jgi:hypothetical protein
MQRSSSIIPRLFLESAEAPHQRDKYEIPYLPDDAPDSTAE